MVGLVSQCGTKICVAVGSATNASAVGVAASGTRAALSVYLGYSHVNQHVNVTRVGQ